MPTLTLSELKDQVLSRLEDNSLMYQSDELTDAVNEAVLCVNLIVGWFQSTYDISTYSTIANRHIYDVPIGIIFPQRVVFNGQVLEKSPLSSMANTWPRFLSETTANTGNQVSRWCPLGIKKFAIHPADSVGGAQLSVTGIVEPDELVEEDDEIQLPKEGITAVCDYAAHIVQCKLQGTPFYQSLSLYRSYEELVNLQKYWLSYKQPNLNLDEQTPVK